MSISLPACAPSPEAPAAQTESAQKQTASLWKLTPAPTSSPTITVTPTLTITLTPTPSHTSTQTPTPTLGVGSVLINPMDNARMVYVPGGSFLAGLNKAGIQALIDEGVCPAGTEESCLYLEQFEKEKSVTLADYWIYVYEVSNAEYATFLNENGNQSILLMGQERFWYDSTSDFAKVFLKDQKWIVETGFENHPVTAASWFGAAVYCGWAGGRLPTLYEWQRAAEGEDNGDYPWGNSEISDDKANICGLTLINDCNEDPECNANIFSEICQKRDDGFAFTAPVDSFHAGISPFGVYNMIGNAPEWAGSYFLNFEKSYSELIYEPYPNPDEVEILDPEYGERAGSCMSAWLSTARPIPALCRSDSMLVGVSGFRCVVIPDK